MVRKKKRHPTKRSSKATEIVYALILSHYADPEKKDQQLTYREIADIMHWRSRNTAFYHVSKLVEQGKVSTDNGCIVLVNR